MKDAKIFIELKDQNILWQTRSYNILKHMKKRGQFCMKDAKIFIELKDQNILWQTRSYNILKHMKNRGQFCIFHNDYEHTLAVHKNLYGQIKSMMKKGELLKYLKKKVLVGSRREI